jgi:hypothetical protein
VLCGTSDVGPPKERLRRKEEPISKAYRTILHTYKLIDVSASIILCSFGNRQHIISSWMDGLYYILLLLFLCWQKSRFSAAWSQRGFQIRSDSSHYPSSSLDSSQCKSYLPALVCMIGGTRRLIAPTATVSKNASITIHHRRMEHGESGILIDDPAKFVATKEG